MDYCDDPDFDSLLQELSNDFTSSEDISITSSLTYSPRIPAVSKIQSKNKTQKKQKFIKPQLTDDSSIESSIESNFILTKPKILRTDIRRSYSTMLVNVILSGDFPLLFGFLDTFTTYNMESEFSRPNHSEGDGSQTLNFRQKGLFDVAKYHYCNFLTKPDAIITTKECNVVTPRGSTNESQVVTRFLFKATALYEEIPCSFTDSIDCDDDRSESKSNIGSKRSCNNEEMERTKMMRNIMASVDNAVSKLSLRSEPFHIDAEGVVTLYLDESKRIIKMVMKCKPSEKMMKQIPALT